MTLCALGPTLFHWTGVPSAICAVAGTNAKSRTTIDRVPDEATWTVGENSDVLPAGSVAVAVTWCPSRAR